MWLRLQGTSVGDLVQLFEQGHSEQAAQTQVRVAFEDLHGGDSTASLPSNLCWCSVTCMLKNLVRTSGILFQAFFSVQYLCAIFQELKE